MMLKDCNHNPIDGTSICPTCPKPDDWQIHAKCLGSNPERWYPEEDHVRQIKSAIIICMGCPVRGFCLEEGWNDKYGIWGSFSAQDRVALRKLFPLPKDKPNKRRIIRTIAHRL